jgi:hypothetical protein
MVGCKGHRYYFRTNRGFSGCVDSEVVRTGTTKPMYELFASFLKQLQYLLDCL